jgi:hypothetical protein
MEKGTLKLQDRQDYLWIFFFEFLGSTLFLFGIMMSAGNISVMVACIYGTSVLCAKYSGAHFNWALTISIYIVEAKWKKNLHIVLLYLVA